MQRRSGWLTRTNQQQEQYEFSKHTKTLAIFNLLDMFGGPHYDLALLICIRSKIFFWSQGHEESYSRLNLVL